MFRGQKDQTLSKSGQKLPKGFFIVFPQILYLFGLSIIFMWILYDFISPFSNHSTTLSSRVKAHIRSHTEAHIRSHVNQKKGHSKISATPTNSY